MRGVSILVAALVALGVSACGGEDSAPSTSASGTSDAGQIEDQNDAVIERAQQSPREQAEAGEKAIRATLTKKLGMKPNGDFDLGGGQDHPSVITVGSDCYAKTGAEAASFSYQKKNILRSPETEDLVFVQSSTKTPLSKCLIAARDALGW